MKLINSIIFLSSVFLGCFLMLLKSCDSITTSAQDRLIARAENHYLYLSDIERNFKTFTSEQDSIIMVSDFINNWARKKLLYEKSLVNLPEEKTSELINLINAYKYRLFINAYREFVLKSTMDTLMTKSLIEKKLEKNNRVRLPLVSKVKESKELGEERVNEVIDRLRESIRQRK